MLFKQNHLNDLKIGDISVIIPAAGNSGRMGSDKALLPAGTGLNFAANLVDNYFEYGVQFIILVVNENLDQVQLTPGAYITVINSQLELGRSWSIQLGIQQLPEGSSCFIQNIDNQFIEHELLEILLAKLKPDCYVIPVFKGRGGHPILLGSKIVQHIRKSINVPDFRQLLNLFERIEVPYPDERILWNINTPEDYNKWFAEN